MARVVFRLKVRDRGLIGTTAKFSHDRGFQFFSNFFFINYLRYALAEQICLHGKTNMTSFYILKASS